jgi:methylated-DNA-[protein]-cysteine S-methyltransferase
MSVYGFIHPVPQFPLWVVANDRGLESVLMGGPAPACDRDDSHPIVAEAIRQLEAYFRRERRDFNVPLAPAGTPYQHRVWAALQRIGYGETRSYQDIAKEIGSVARAVGGANGSNPIAIIVPCHRVIGQTGKLTGYGGGLERKQYLLDLERGHGGRALAGAGL